MLMHPYSKVSPITQQLVQVHAIVEKIAGVNGPLLSLKNLNSAAFPRKLILNLAAKYSSGSSGLIREGGRET